MRGHAGGLAPAQFFPAFLLFFFPAFHHRNGPGEVHPASYKILAIRN